MCDLYLNQSVHLTGAQAHLVFFDSACFLLDGADDCIVGWGLGACPIAILRSVCSSLQLYRLI